MNKKFLIITILVAIAGLILSILLAKVGISVANDPAYKSFCNFNEAYNCETVARSVFSTHFGIPNFVYGMAFYLLVTCFGILCLLDEKPVLPNFFVYLFWLSLFSVGVSVYLFTVSILYIKSKCVLCMMVYIVNIVLLMVAFMAEKCSIKHIVDTLLSDLKLYFSSSTRTIIFVIAALCGIGILFYTNMHPLLGQDEPGSSENEFVKVDYSKTSADRLVTGPTDKIPELTIVEFTDFECPFCGRASAEMKKVLKNNPDIRLVFKEYPLDMSCNQRITKPFHEHACRASLYARCAAEQGNFWEYHDMLFENQESFDKDSLNAFAESLKLDMKQFEECVKSERHMPKILTNIDEAVALGVSGTPTFFIEGRKIVGFRTADEYQTAINEIKEEIAKEKEEYEKKKEEFLKKQQEVQEKQDLTILRSKDIKDKLEKKDNGLTKEDNNKEDQEAKPEDVNKDNTVE
ncbi:MAG: thioredoxin domain-containing protein [Cyanobacteriota bacterium]